MSKPFGAKDVGACFKHVLSIRLFAGAPRSWGLWRLMKQLAISGPADPVGASGGDPIAEPTRDCVQTLRLEHIYRSERPSLLRRLARRTGIDQAEDMIQQVFVRLAGRPEAVETMDVPSRYLGEAVRNLERDEARAAIRRSQQQSCPDRRYRVGGQRPDSPPRSARPACADRGGTRSARNR